MQCDWELMSPVPAVALPWFDLQQQLLATRLQAAADLRVTLGLHTTITTQAGTRTTSQHASANSHTSGEALAESHAPVAVPANNNSAAGADTVERGAAAAADDDRPSATHNALTVSADTNAVRAADNQSGNSGAGVRHASAHSNNHPTAAYRLVNSEGDRLSGLIVDVYGHHLVVAASSGWVVR